MFYFIFILQDIYINTDTFNKYLYMSKRILNTQGWLQNFQPILLFYMIFLILPDGHTDKKI